MEPTTLVLQKIRQEQVTATIVTPQWPTAVWYPTIKMMSVAAPLPIPRHHVLPAPGNAPDILAKNPHWSLTAWRVSGAASRRKDGIPTTVTIVLNSPQETPTEAIKKGARVDDVVVHGNWSSSIIFDRFYRLTSASAVNFTSLVLS